MSDINDRLARLVAAAHDTYQPAPRRDDQSDRCEFAPGAARSPWWQRVQ